MDGLPIGLLHDAWAVLLVASAVLANSSVIAQARVPWWRSQMGRHLMFYMAVVAGTLDIGCARLVAEDTLAFQWIRVLAFVPLPFALAQRLWLQIKAQRSTTEPVGAADDGGGAA